VREIYERAQIIDHCLLYFRENQDFFPPLQQTARKDKIMDVIHKKNGKLHIYVRQDKYKGELKSHNWVGRTYIDGKQRIISSKTTDLEKATIILEKWFDDLQLRKIQSNDISKIEDNIPKDEVKSKIVDSNPSDNTPPSTKSNLNMFDEFKKN